MFSRMRRWVSTRNAGLVACGCSSSMGAVHWLGYGPYWRTISLGGRGPASMCSSSAHRIDSLTGSSIRKSLGVVTGRLHVSDSEPVDRLEGWNGRQVSATAPGQRLSAQLGPTLVLEERVVLQEADDHYVGQPISLIPVDDGSFVIADAFSNSALHFDSRGRYRATFGRRGEGPGEFRFISPAGFVAGDLVGFGDDREFQLGDCTAENRSGYY